MLHETDKESTLEEIYGGSFDLFRRYFKEISKYEILSREKEFDLSMRLYEFKDEEARSKLIVSNLRLVVKIAMEYQGASNIMDLIQEGNKGLIRATAKYNPFKGSRFSSYSFFWIRAHILKFIMDQWSIVKIGETDACRRLFYRLKREKERLAAEGVEITTQKIASTMGVKEEEVIQMEKMLIHNISLEAPLNKGEDGTFGDYLQDETDVEDVIFQRDQKERVHRWIDEFEKGLDERGAFILRNRICIDESLTLREVGEKVNLSKERVRRWEIKLTKDLVKFVNSKLISSEKRIECK